MSFYNYLVCEQLLKITTQDGLVVEDYVEKQIKYLLNTISQQFPLRKHKK